MIMVITENGAASHAQEECRNASIPLRTADSRSKGGKGGKHPYGSTSYVGGSLFEGV